jgi:phosphoribosyl-AMP cyclohydrolase / phosphoribosyl-ATP pyrophosphohydrolase
MTRPEELKWDSAGLIPAVVQDASTGEVLMVAYVSRESLERTREVGETVFYSRSRKTLWHKGETSGNVQRIVSVAADCDKDTLVIRVDPAGPACHTGTRTCFTAPVDGFAAPGTEPIGQILGDLERIIASRKTERPEGSYTAKLFDKGTNRIFQKVGEEAVEAVVAGVTGNREELIRESSDLLYHLLVGLADAGVSLDEVARELASRRK